MKIRVINPNSSHSMTEHLRKTLEQIRNRDTELSVCCAAGAPAAIECAYDEAMCAAPTLREVQRAWEDGCDAVILACFSDPVLAAAREISSKLVMGIEQTSIHIAEMLGHRYTILTLNEERVPNKTEDCIRNGAQQGLASVRALGLRVAQTDADPALTKERILAVSRAAAEEDGAEVIVLGCAGMAGYAADVEQVLHMTVIDPSSVTLKVTEALVSLGICQSKRGLYAFPPAWSGEK